MRATHADTPLFRQYHAIKEQHPDKLVLFHMGDFYELFYADATKAATLLGITLTQRKSSSGPIPMAGVPVQSVEQYISRLVRIGETVVVCEQKGSSEEGKGLMTREVTQIVTPGTLTDLNLLPTNEAAVAVALAPAKTTTGYAWLDLARGELRGGQCAPKQVGSVCARINPAELLVPEGANVPAGISAAITHLPAWDFQLTSTYHRMCERFNVNDLHGFGLENYPYAVAAMMALLDYAESSKCQRLENIWQIGFEQLEHLVALDHAARTSLEISQSLVSEGPTLRSTIDNCVTAAGSRLLRKRLHHPQRDLKKLQQQQEQIEHVIPLASELRQHLEGGCDLERVTTRISLQTVRPRELGAVRDLLHSLPGIRNLVKFANLTQPAINHDYSKLLQLLNRLAKDIPAQLKDGGVFAPGVAPELDDLRDKATGSQATIAAIEQRERATTKIKTLRIGHNRVYGYYLEISRGQSHKAPSHYRRRQSLKNVERFLIDELAELEQQQLTATERILGLERQLYDELLTALQPQLDQLRQLADELAQLDLASNLAQLIANKNWVRPSYTEHPSISIEQGWHPVVAENVDYFVPNNTQLDSSMRLQVITGPNMGGKSTYMRQVAQIALLALAGMPVPAKAATIGMLDSIQTRVGAGDDLAGGRSTFMVEMAETAAILNTATPHSLVLLDEIGRGTSTFDGLSLAWATAQALLERNQSLVLLATHYLELAALPKKIPGATNVHMAVGESDKEAVMLHRVEAGAASRSFGLQVARMAGIPSHVLTTAATLLKEFELQRSADQAQLFDVAKQPAASDKTEVLEKLRSVTPDNLSPREALELLYELHRLDQEG